MEPTVTPAVVNEMEQFIQGMGTNSGKTLSELIGGLGVWVLVLAGLGIVLYIVQALMIGGLARSKGYSFFGNFLLGLVFSFFALIYEAGRPISYERECVMQDRLAMQTAKELYKLQRAREKAQTPSMPSARKLPQ